jgi:hypothetical protein
MTATHVGAVAVVADEPAQSPIKDVRGNPIFFKQIRELLLEDGTAVFGCVHCDYTGASTAVIRPHLRVHKDPSSGGRKRDLTLKELIREVEGMEEIKADRDRWKARAELAERKLAQFRAAFREL